MMMTGSHFAISVRSPEKFSSISGFIRLANKGSVTAANTRAMRDVAKSGQ